MPTPPIAHARATLAAAAAVILLAAGASPASADVRDEPPQRWISFGTGVTGVVLDAASGDYFVTTSLDAVAVVDRYDGSAQRATIMGDATGLHGPRQPALGPDGELVVPSMDSGTVSVFAAGAEGNATPVRVLANGISSPNGVAVGADGSTYTANYGNDTIAVHDPQAGPNTAPVRVLQGAGTGLDQPTDAALAGGELFVTNFSGSVTVYPAGADGDTAPTRTITSDTIAGAESVTLDGSGNIYVAVLYGAVEVFAPDASGASTPIVSLHGPDTGLNSSLCVLVEPDRSVTVANDVPGTVTTFAPLVPFTVPSRVRSLSVSGPADARRRTVDWKAPLDDGGRPVGNYLVEVRRDGETVLRRTVTATEVTLHRGDLPRGKLSVRVRARSAEGLGAASVERFTVRT